jgi:hypothetical protein
VRDFGCWGGGTVMDYQISKAKRDGKFCAWFDYATFTAEECTDWPNVIRSYVGKLSDGAEVKFKATDNDTAREFFGLYYNPNYEIFEVVTTYSLIETVAATDEF